MISGDFIYRLVSYPHSYREAIVRLILAKYPTWRPHYSLCLEECTKQALMAGYDRVSVIEFGVAGGNGLICLEKYCERITKKTGLKFDIYGFDMGDDVGLPISSDHRDIMHLWQPGDYKMELNKLKNSLKSAELILGDVNQTVDAFCDRDIAPLGACFFDLDYFTSTRAALRILESQNPTIPRVLCYFDDIEVSSIFTGVQAAINDFNLQHDNIKIDQMGGHHHHVKFGTLYTKIFHAHFFSHENYNNYVAGTTLTQLPLKTK